MPKPRFPASLLAALIILLGFTLRIAAIDGQSLWVDEGYTLDGVVQHPLRLIGYKVPDLIAPDSFPLVGTSEEHTIWLSTDIHPPLYFLALVPWVRLAGTTEAALRFPSLIWSVVTIPLVYVLARRLLGTRAGLLSSLFCALSAFAVAYAQEARMYALLSLEAAALLVFAARWLFDGDRRGRVVVGYVAAASTAMYTHYFAGFLLLALNLLVAGATIARLRIGPSLPLRGLSNLNQGVRFWASMQALALLLFAPWIGVTFHQIAIYPGRESPFPPLQWVLGLSWMAANLGLSLREDEGAVALTALALIAALGLALGFRREPIRRLPLTFLLGMTLIPLALYLAILPAQPHYHPRYLLPLTVPYFALLGGAITAIAGASRLAGGLGAAAVAGAMLSGVILYFWNTPYQKDEAREVAQSLSGRALPTEAILVDAREPIHHYYQGVAAYSYMGNEPDTPDRLTRILEGRTGVWLVQWWLSRLDAAGLVPYLLSKYGRLDASEQYRGYRLLHYQLPTPVERVETEETALPLGLRFQPGFELVSAGHGAALADRSPDGSVASGGLLWAALRWRLNEPVHDDAKATVRLLDANGETLAQDDDPLAVDIISTRHWRTGWETSTFHTLQLPTGLPPGQYQLRASLYWKQTGTLLRPAQPGPMTTGAMVNLGDVRVAKPSAQQLPTAAEMPFRKDTLMGQEILLLGHKTRPQEAQPGHQVSSVIFWRAVQTPREDYSARLVLRKTAGQVALAGPAWPLAEAYPSQDWGTGEIIRTSPRLTITSRVEPGWYMLGVQVVSEGATSEPVDLGSVQVLPAPPAFPIDPHPKVPLAASVGEGIELLGYDLDPEVPGPGDTLRLTLYWAAQAEIPSSYSVFTQLLDSAQRIAAQHDGSPDNGVRPTAGWRVGEVIRDEHRIELPRSLPGGSYVLQVGMYEPNTLRRLPMAGPREAVVDDALRLRTLQVRR